MHQTDTTDFEQRLAKEVAGFYADPLGFVRTMYPWGEPATSLEHATGPDKWQAEFLTRLGAAVRQRTFAGVTAIQPIRMAVSSGHGIGKSTLVAWIVDWIMSTRTDSRGTITANTFTQVQDKTWAAIRKWTPLCLTGPWFEVTAERLRRRDHPESQFCSATSCREENSEAFAGQHAKTSTSFYIFDEASAVPDTIYEVAEGGLTDGEPMIFLFGNPTRSTGMFHRVCFGAARNRWDSVTIDSRESAFTNKAQIAEWAEDYGEDSDFFRVRVRGLPPSASDLQFIDSQIVFAAQQRPATSLPDDPLVCGLDVALVLDGKTFAESTMVVALGITMAGEKRFLGFVETDTENEQVLTPFLRSLVERGLDVSQGLLVIVDGGKGLRAAVRKAFRHRALVQRCQWHKGENVVSYVAKREQPVWRQRLQRAYNRPEYDEARAALETLHRELEDRNQSAARSLAEGFDETLTLHRLGLYGALGRSLKTTNCLESVNALVEERCAKVDHWQNSRQRHRWLATALLDIEPRLRKVIGYRHLPKLRAALTRELKIDTTTSKKEAA